MPRLMSVTFTEEAVRARRKSVTRRKGWRDLKPGTRLTLCRRLRVSPIVRIADVEVIDVRRERLEQITAADVAREGFPGMSPAEFIDTFFVKAQSMRPTDEVTRIEWRYLTTEDAATATNTDVPQHVPGGGHG